MNITLTLLNYFLNSPLDQFGVDADFAGLADNVFTDFLPTSIFDELTS